MTLDLRQVSTGSLRRYKDSTGKSVETLEKEKASKAMLESQNKAQVEFNCELRDEVAQLRAQLSMAKTNAERQATKLADSEAKRKELEAALQVLYTCNRTLQSRQILTGIRH